MKNQGRTSWLSHAIKTRDFILDLLFPRECLNCGQEGTWLCEKCFRKLPLKSGQYCLNCKHVNQYGEFCSSCQANYALNGIWIAGDYENAIIARLVQKLKYKFIKDLSQPLGQYLTLFMRNLLNLARLTAHDLGPGPNWREFNKLTKSPQILLDFKACLVMPVPLHKKRWRWRGFNQAQALAENFTANFRLPLITSGLIRYKHTKPQASLNEAERRHNLIGCFAWQGDNLNGQHVILIDDVATTGATLNECARVLKEAGASEVWGLVVAKG